MRHTRAHRQRTTASTRTGRVLVGLAGLVAVLSGCETQATTVVDARDGDTVVQFEVRFSGDGADAAWEQRASLEKVFTERGLGGVKTVRDGGAVVVQAGASIEAVVREQSVTGIAGVTVEPRGDQVAVAVQLVAPSALADAVRAGVVNEPDAEALAAAALGSTRVGAVVKLAKIDDAAYTTQTAATSTEAVTVAVEHDGRSAGWWFDLAEPQPGVLVVTGSAETGRSRWWLVALAAFVAAAAWDWRRRRAVRQVRDAIGW